MRECFESQKKYWTLNSLETEILWGFLKLYSVHFFIMIWPLTYEGQREECGCLNENGPHRLMFECMSPFDRAV